MEELYNDLYGNNVTIISNEFLEKYLSDADPIFIKVLLFYIWKGLKEGYTIEEASDELILSAEEVEKALKYWIRKKLMKKECIVKEKQKKNSESENENKLLDFQTKKKELIKKNKKEYSEIERNLLFVAEKLLGQTITIRQKDLIEKCYNEYGFEEGLIHYLLDYCSSVGKTNANYMGAVAASWYEEGVKSVDEAKKYTDGFGKKSYPKAKKTSKANVIDRNDYNQMFVDSILNNKS